MDWNAMAAPWLTVEAATDVAHSPVLRGILDRAGLQSGQSVLDIGPGGGISLIRAAQAVGPDGAVTGVEIAPPFAARARERVPDHVEVVVADAQDHAFEPERHDAAISLFGVMFFRDPVSAFANIRTAMKPGASLTFGCWGPPMHNPWFAMPARVASGVFGPGPAFDPDRPGPMSFAQPDKIDGILRAAGWTPEIESVDLHLTPEGTPEQVADLHMTIGAAVSRMDQAREAGTLQPDHADTIRAGLVDGFAAMMQDEGVRVPARIHFVRARA